MASFVSPQLKRIFYSTIPNEAKKAYLRFFFVSALAQIYCYHVCVLTSELYTYIYIYIYGTLTPSHKSGKK